MKCPHERIEYCPLYLESHYTRGLGCVDDMAKPCRVARGKMDYEKSKARVVAINPRECAIQAFNEAQDKAKQQRVANMRNNGIH